MVIKGILPFWTVFFIALAPQSLSAQTNNLTDQLLTLNVNNMAFNDVLTLIEQQTSFRFAYSTELVARQKKVTVNISNGSLNEVLDILLKGTNMIYSIIENQIILEELPPPQITISGFIKDSISGESLPGTIIYFPESKTGTYTNNYGFFSITQNRADSLDMVISYMGFNKIYARVGAQKNSNSNFFLTESKIPLKSILIKKSSLDDNIKKNQLGKTDISFDMIRAVPAINGNGDIINTIQMLPGVLAGLDGRSGFFIRGGNTDQNLVLLDEATLYNPSHFLGLVSIFNSSAIKYATLLKGGFPASFGDHLSSVLDVTMKDGNTRQLEGDVQVGTVTSGFTLSGPIIENKATFFLAARHSTIDFLLKPLDLSDYYKDYDFYDINAKLNFQVSQKDRLYLSFYQGKDNTSFLRDTTTYSQISYNDNYGNQAVTLRWNHLFSQKIFANTSVIYNNYFESVTATQKKYYAQLYSGIRDINFKTDFNFYPSSTQKISAGISYLFQTLFPASVSDKTITTGSFTPINPTDIPRKYSNRFAGYFSDEVWFTPKLSAYLGVRVPLFATENTQYLQFEPRLSLLYLLNTTSSIKISYTQMHQYLHLVQSCNASFPAEIWLGSSSYVKPENSQQVSIGLFKNFRKNMFQSSIELYYKYMGNQMVFKGATNPSIDGNIDSTLLFGQGKSYGAEIFLRKNTGKFTGWLAYTLSFAYQQFDSLNFGKEFPFANDRRHCFYITGNYALGKHWTISSNFLLTSGSTFTLNKKVNSSSYSNPLYDDYGGTSDPIPITEIEMNNIRLDPYNRLDLSISYHSRWERPNRTIESEWTFSIYNIYARANTFFAYRSVDPVTKKPSAMQVSFVPFIPSITYHLSF